MAAIRSAARALVGGRRRWGTVSLLKEDRVPRAIGRHGGAGKGPCLSRCTLVCGFGMDFPHPVFDAGLPKPQAAAEWLGALSYHAHASILSHLLTT